MTAAVIHWLWSLPDQDLSAVIGLGLITGGCAMAVLRKIGKWT